MGSNQTAPRHGLEFLEYLENVIRQRAVTGSKESYVAKLLLAGDKRLAQKLGEEAVELAIAATAGTRAEQVEEAADLLFHLLVLLNAKDIRLAQVVALLEQRHITRDGTSAG